MYDLFLNFPITCYSAPLGVFDIEQTTCRLPTAHRVRISSYQHVQKQQVPTIDRSRGTYGLLLA